MATKQGVPHLQTLSPTVPGGFASPCTLGITPLTGSGLTAHGHISAFSNLGTSGLGLPRNMELVLLVQPNTSSCKPIYSQTLLAAWRSNWCVLLKDLHTAQNILSKTRLFSRHTIIIRPPLTDDSSPRLLFHSPELVTTLSCDQQGETQHNYTVEIFFFVPRIPNSYMF